jgi:hypothetical protein
MSRFFFSKINHSSNLNLLISWGTHPGITKNMTVLSFCLPVLHEPPNTHLQVLNVLLIWKMILNGSNISTGISWAMLSKNVFQKKTILKHISNTIWIHVFKTTF